MYVFIYTLLMRILIVVHLHVRRLVLLLCLCVIFRLCRLLLCGPRIFAVLVVRKQEHQSRDVEGQPHSETEERQSLEFTGLGYDQRSDGKYRRCDEAQRRKHQTYVRVAAFAQRLLQSDYQIHGDKRGRQRYYHCVGIHSL